MEFSMYVLYKNIYQDDYNHVKYMIQSQVDQGKMDFIIYPYGLTGILAHMILKYDYQIEPVLILDDVNCVSAQTGGGKDISPGTLG